MAAGWQPFFDGLSEFLRSAERQFGLANHQYTEHVVERLQMFSREISILKDVLEHSSNLDQQSHLELQQISSKLEELNSNMRIIKLEWERYLDTLIVGTGSMSAAYRVQQLGTGSRGRPRFQVQKEQLEYLSSLGFSWSAIAALLGVSRMTIYRRREEYGLLRDPQNTVSDQDLVTILSHLRQEHPNIGETMVIGHLRAMGYRVP